MGPISSGLGEVFQFAVRGDGVSPAKLKETLDWYIGPQLRLVPGVVEVNSFGGVTKQYEVALDPHRMQTSGVSVDDVVIALKNANGNAGGGYLEDGDEQLVVGALGLIRNVDDLRSVVLSESKDGVPVTIGRVASRIGEGAALRRGSASMDGKGEVTVGVVMMLMGANARVVTSAVKAKIAELAPTLPQGVVIEAFYDREALVDRTIHTVGKNLIEGAILVILVLVLLLGNVRGGAIVATVIPLAMLLAAIAMHMGHRSGNLMSLGAIDFGLLVDGAVIVIENAVRPMSEAQHNAGRVLNSDERLDVVEKSTIEMLSASLFGQVVIAIVYVPILGLTGVEGKMFQPMAVTVLLALAGAFIATITVVPVLASFALRGSHGGETFIMRHVTRGYEVTLRRAIRRRWMTLAIGVVALAASFVVGRGLGAEFVPKLDEGDVLVEARRLPGISLSGSIATDRRMQRALLEIPEVAHVVSKTGSPDLANDPMGIEQTDIYIKLKPTDEWRRGMIKAELAELIAAKLEERVPDVAIGLSQPIEMRTNELVAGVKSDLAVEIYGSDLEELQRQANRVESVLRKIPGAVDVRSEQVQGLSYLRIVPNRDDLARHHLTIDDVNSLTTAMAVGHKAGVIREGDRRFDVVVKLAGVTGDVAGSRNYRCERTKAQPYLLATLPLWN
jgi:heavy metal efflux system protein